jgi:hypothetical protein
MPKESQDVELCFFIGIPYFLSLPRLCAIDILGKSTQTILTFWIS